MTNEYVNLRRINYDCGDAIGVASFVPVCEKCHRFVRYNPQIRVNEMTGLSKEPNAICKHCGPTHMPFEGFF